MLVLTMQEKWQVSIGLLNRESHALTFYLDAPSHRSAPVIGISYPLVEGKAVDKYYSTDTMRLICVK